MHDRYISQGDKKLPFYGHFNYRQNNITKYGIVSQDYRPGGVVLHQIFGEKMDPIGCKVL